jgi:hypothetical protein
MLPLWRYYFNQSSNAVLSGFRTKRKNKSRRLMVVVLSSPKPLTMRVLDKEKLPTETSALIFIRE